MKILSYLLFLIIIISCSGPVVQNNAVIEFEKMEYDFKQLNLKEEAECSFEFSNPGNSPIIVHNVETTCGCTVPDWPKEPVKPLGKGKILIKYDTSHPGSFSKTIKVFYNGKDSPVYLSIKGSVNYSNDL